LDNAATITLKEFAVRAEVRPPFLPPRSCSPPALTLPLAFTGAPLSREWMIGAAELLLGAALVIVARWRRRSPKHAAK
jgi:hypothetical protein